MTTEIDTAYFAAAIAMALYTDYENEVGEPPKDFHYEILHVEDDENGNVVVMFRGNYRARFGGAFFAQSWLGTALFQYEIRYKDSVPNIVQVTQYLEGEPYVYNV